MSKSETDMEIPFLLGGMRGDGTGQDRTLLTFFLTVI